MRTRAIVATVLLIGAMAFLYLLYIPTCGRPPHPNAVAWRYVVDFKLALRAYERDHGALPGHDGPQDVDIPGLLYEALRGREGSDETGRRRVAPYMRFASDDLGVESSPGAWRPPTREEQDDPTVSKYILDPWGRPYHYIGNPSRSAKIPSMPDANGYDLWSDGPDRVDEGGAGDDIRDRGRR